MYFFELLTFIVIAFQAHFTSNACTRVDETSLLQHTSSKVSIDEIDSILEYLYEIRNKEKDMSLVEGHNNEHPNNSIVCTGETTQLSNIGYEIITNNTRTNDEDVNKPNAYSVEGQYKTQASAAATSFDNCTASPCVSTQALPGCSFDNDNSFSNDSCNDFKFLLLDLLKNMSYYRLNIGRLMRSLRICLYKKRKIIINPSKALQKKIIHTFTELSLLFVKNPTEFLKTDNSIFNTENLQQTKEMREMLLTTSFRTTNKHNKIENSIARKIKTFNSVLTATTVQMLKKSSFKKIICFCNKNLVGGLNIYRYYDMFVCFMPSLYKISLFLDANIKDAFEKHLSCPPLPEGRFYGDYSLMQENVFFHWLTDWLYYFCNFCEFPTLIGSNSYASDTVKLYPQEFFIQLCFLTKLVCIKQAGIQDIYQFNNVFVEQLKEKIKTALFMVDSHSSESFLQVTFMFIFTGITDTFSNKIYKTGRGQRTTLIRTTEEHIQCADALDMVLSTAIDRIFNLVLRLQ